MHRVLKGIAVAGMIASLLALAALAGVFLEQPARAQTDEPAEQSATGGDLERLITVTGRGTVSARPDRATVRIGVQTEAETAAAALEQNNVQMNDVISATLEAGVDEADIQTVGLRLSPRYDQNEEGPPTLIGYEAANTVAVTVQDLDNLGVLLDSAVAAGGNTVEGIQFEIGDNDALRAQAREAAMAEAIAKAEQLTDLAGAQLGEVVTIEELGSTEPRPVAVETADTARAAAVPVQAGQQSVESSIRVTWRIR